MRGNGAAGMAGSRQAPCAAFGKGGIIHRAGGDQAFGDAGDFAVQGGGAGSDGFPCLALGLRSAGPAGDAAFQHAPKPGLGRRKTRQMGQRRFTQPRRIGRRAGGAAGAFWRVRHGVLLA